MNLQTLSGNGSHRRPGRNQTGYLHEICSLGEGDFFVTDKCKYPEAALRWIDYFFTTEGALSSQYGAEEGTDWF